MKKIYIIALLIVLTLVIIEAQAQQMPTLRLTQKILLPNVEGRIDHLAIDIESNLLFIAALGNDTVEVIDLHLGKHIKSISGFHEPQGLIFIPGLNELYVTNGGSGKCDILDIKSFNVINSIQFADEADNIRYDAVANLIYVGYGNGGLGVIDAVRGKLISNVKFNGHPESFQFEKNGQRVFVNVPTADNITIIDKQKCSVIARWLLSGANKNFPMALDEGNHRLFIGCREPARLIVFDTESGHSVASVDIGMDVDDIYYDPARKCIYVSSGGGFVDVIEQRGVNNYIKLSEISTAPGARTALFVPEQNRLYLAVPHRVNQPCEIWVYEVK